VGKPVGTWRTAPAHVLIRDTVLGRASAPHCALGSVRALARAFLRGIHGDACGQALRPQIGLDVDRPDRIGHTDAVFSFWGLLGGGAVLLDSLDPRPKRAKLGFEIPDALE
jgi:hypothetical protein